MTTPAEFPKVLYKFRPIHSQGHINPLRRLLIRRQAYFSDVESLNDPHEFLYKLNITATRQERWQLSRLWAKTSKKNYLYRSERMRAIWLYLHYESNWNDPQYIRKFKDQFPKHFGVFSTSSTATNSVMWAHYAGNHTGVCIGIEVSRKMNVRQVRYQKRMPLHRLTDYLKIGPECMYPVLLTKGKEWSYENEWRWFGPPKTVKVMPPSAITEIIFGVRTSETDKQLIRLWALKGNLYPKYLQAVRTDNEFSIKLKEVD